MGNRRSASVCRISTAMWFAVAIWLSLSPTVSRAETENEKLLLKAAAAVEDGLYPEADKMLEKYIKRARSIDTKARGQILLAESLVGRKRFHRAHEAVAGVEKRVKDDDLVVGLLYWQARALYELERTQDADAVLSELPKSSESKWQVPAHFLRVRVARELGKRDAALKAMKTFSTLYADHPRAPDNLFEWGLLLIESKRGVEGLDVLRTLLRTFPDHEKALEGKLWMARELFLQGEADESKALLQSLGSNEDATPTIRLEALRSLAQFYEKEDRHGPALNVLNEALALELPSEEVSLLKAMQALIYLHLDEDEKAIQLMHDSGQGMTNRVAASRLQLQLADDLLQKKKYALAFQEYQRFLEVFTDDQGRGLAALGKAWSLFGLQRYGEAAEFFRQATDGVMEESTKEEAYIKLGDAWFGAENYENAVDAYRDFLKRYPSSGLRMNARFQLAESLARLGEIGDAVQELRGIEASTDNVMRSRLAAVRVAELEQRSGNYAQAINAYNWIIDRYDDEESLAQALLGRASVLYHQGKFYEALSDLEELGGRYANTEYAEQAMAMSVWCHYLAGRDQDALKLASDFIEAYPGSSLSPQIQFWKAEYRYNRDEFLQAEELFAELARTYPNHELADDALYWAGRSAFERQELREAITWNKKLIEQFPDSPKWVEARFSQGDALSKLGEYSGAIIAFEDITRLFPDHYLVDDAIGRIGDCYFTLGAQDAARYRDSLDAYLMLLSRGRAPLEIKQQAQYKIGRCYEKLNDDELALQYYTELVYDYLAAVREGNVVSSVWFSRSAFAAAELLEADDRLKEAANLYKRVVAAQVPAGEDAQRRLQKLQFQHLRIL